jgi:heme A synthase
VGGEVRSPGRLHVRPRDTVLLTALAVALLLITALAFEGLLNLVSGILIVVAFLVAGRFAAIRGGQSRSIEGDGG